MTSLLKIGALTVDATKYEIPNERVFREAWSFADDPNADVITVDMSKARDIWRNKIRLARESELTRLDAAFMKALETGADASDIIAQKKALRDAPADPAIDMASTPEELKLVKPAGLKIE